MIKFKKIFIAVDPATGEGQQHDCTAIVAGMTFVEKVAGRNVTKVFILPEFVNARLEFGSAIEAILNMHQRMKTVYGAKDYEIRVLIENAGQQKSFYDATIQSCPFPPKFVEYMSTKGIDKRSRTAAACSYMQSKRVLFPRDSLEDLIEQLLSFGSKSHDDLSDAFAMVVNRAMSEKHSEIGMATLDYYPGQKKDEDKENVWFYAQGQRRYGNPREYYEKLQEIVDIQDEHYNRGLL